MMGETAKRVVVPGWFSDTGNVQRIGPDAVLVSIFSMAAPAISASFTLTDAQVTALVRKLSALVPAVQPQDAA